MFKLVLLISTIFILSCSGANLPSWPKQFRWFWGHNTAGYDCITINEPGTPAFNDNKLCWESGYDSPGFKWSFGGKYPGMKCTSFNDPINGYWVDNYLCVPKDSPYDFTFSCGGRPQGRACININEPAEGGWADNFLCATAGAGPSF